MAAAATPSPSSLPEFLDNECFCPVCLEEFHEPKSLPNCAHNVCKPCLQNMTPSDETSISCPVCRAESKVPPGGVGCFPTNCLVVKLLDATPGRREKIEMRRLLDECHTNIARVQTSVENTEKRKKAIQHCLTLKKEIRASSLKFTEAIRLKEAELCKEVDRLFGFVSDGSLDDTGMETYWSEWLQLSRDFVNGAESVLEKGNLSDIVKRRDSLVPLAKDIIDAKCDLTDHAEDATKYVSVIFVPSDGVFSQVRDEGFGKLIPESEIENGVFETDGGRNAAGFSIGLSVPRSISRSMSSQSVSIDRTVTARDIGLDSLSPLTISSNSQGDIAVADPSNKLILVLNNQGRLKRKFASSCSGLAFGPGGEIVAVSHTKEVQFLNPQNGGLLSIIQGQDSGLRNRTVTCDGTDKLMVTCESSSLLHKPCVYIYGLDSNGWHADLKCRFGMGASPFKAVRHRDQYFVSNTSKGCVVVYDNKGQYVRQFGKRKHSDGALTSPVGLALHPQTSALLVCDSNTQSIQMYETSGRFVDKFDLEGSPSDVTVLQDGTVVICSQNDHWVKFFSLDGSR